MNTQFAFKLTVWVVGFGCASVLVADKVHARNCEHPNLAISIDVQDGQKPFDGLEADLFKTGAGIHATLNLKNLTHHEVAFLFDAGLAGPAPSTRVRVWSNEGRLVAQTRFSRVAYTSRNFKGSDWGDVAIPPLGADSRDFRIDLYYKFLFPGSYTVQVEMPDPENVSCRIESEPTSFSVTN